MARCPVGESLRARTLPQDEQYESAVPVTVWQAGQMRCGSGIVPDLWVSWPVVFVSHSKHPTPFRWWQDRHVDTFCPEAPRRLYGIRVEAEFRAEWPTDGHRVDQTRVHQAVFTVDSGPPLRISVSHLFTRSWNWSRRTGTEPEADPSSDVQIRLT